MKPTCTLLVFAGALLTFIGCSELPEAVTDGATASDAGIGAADGRSNDSAPSGSDAGSNGSIDGGSDGGLLTGDAIDTQCVGTCYYVTPTGAGAKNGADWNNAFAGLPSGGQEGWATIADLERGASYYLASGDYDSYYFDTAVDATKRIRIIKATSENAGAIAGWSNAYAGRANLGGLVFATSYYDIVGGYRNEAKWDDSAAYGMSVATVIFNAGSYTAAGSHVAFWYLDVGTNAGSNTFSASYQPHAFNFYPGAAPTLSDYTISHCYAHNFRDVPIRFNKTDHALIEYNFIGPSWTKEAIRGDAGVNDVIVRHNIFWNNCQDDPTDPSANGCTAELGIWDGGGTFDNWQVYGNAFINTVAIDHSDGVILAGAPSMNLAGNNASGWRVYDNVIAGVSGGGTVALKIFGTDNQVHDNRWYDLGGAISTGCTASMCTNNAVVDANPWAPLLPGIASQL